jgi:adenosine deaminase
MFHSNLLDEYEVARSVFGLPDEQLVDLARAGVRASFADDTLKNELETDIDRWLAEPGEES